MKISKKRLEALKRRGRSGARRAAGGLKSNGLQVLGGAGAALLITQISKMAPQAMSMGWWAAPGALVALGLLAKRSRRFAGMGDAALGAAGALGVVSYRQNVQGETGRVFGPAFRPHLVPRQLPADASVPLEAGRVYRAGRAR
jgi:hypothetical protein